MARVLLLVLALVAFAAEAQILRIQRYNTLKAEQKWEEALNLIREEVKSPLLSRDSYLADLRTVAIGALGDYATRFGVTPEMDAEAARYYKEGVAAAGSDEQREGQMHTTYARYFSNTKRNGLALPYYRTNLEFWKKRGNTFLTFISLDALASAYSDMGEIALRDHYRELALATAADYFTPGRNKPTPNQWLQYSSVLDKTLDGLARNAPVDELDRLAKIRLDISDRYLLRKSQGYSTVAVKYAIGGHIARAEQLLAAAKEHLAKDLESVDAKLRDVLEHDFRAKIAQIDFFAGRYEAAEPAFAAARKERADRAFLQDDPGLPRLHAQALEKLGRFDAAAEGYRASIKLFEGVRQSYTVAERAAFFRSVAQRSYLGLIRVAARQAGPEAGIARFWEAVQASEMVRARQLGDLVDPNAPPAITPQTLDALRASLGPARAVLYFTLAEDQLVTLAFTADRHLAAVQPVDPALADSIRGLARDLSRAESPMERIEQSLARLGGTLLAPVAEMLKGRSELIVLPDGVLNLVPFDLVGMPGGAYQPLAQTHRVRLVPSLRFVGRSLPPPAGKGLLVVADPKFPQSPTVSALPEAELRAVTRGNRYMDYFKPLPETRTEAQAIRALFPADGAQLLLGEQATRSGFKGAAPGKFSHVHFATHGILGGEVPGVGEPALVLTAEGDDGGFLTASEIAELKLDAQLAVLSACNTGSGEYVTGEGVMGLSRAFLIAGSRAVVMSLWPVASKATEQLMVQFYTNLRAGQDPHEALRAAKLKFRDDAQKAGSIERHPFFWAPFVVFGG